MNNKIVTVHVLDKQGYTTDYTALVLHAGGLDPLDLCNLVLQVYKVDMTDRSLGGWDVVSDFKAIDGTMAQAAKLLRGGVTCS